MAAIKSDALTVLPMRPVFKNSALNDITGEIYSAVNDTAAAVDNGLRRVSIALAIVADDSSMLAADGFKSVKEYGAALGFKESTVYSLTAAGRLYRDESLSDTIKTLPPSKIRELSNIVKKGNDNTLAAVNRDADTIAGMTQSELRDYTTRALTLTKEGRLSSETASVLNPDDIDSDIDSDNLSNPTKTGKPEKLFTLSRLSGDNKLSVMGSDGSAVVLPVENVEPDTVTGWKEYFKDAGCKLYSAGQGDLELPDGTRPLRFVVLSPFNDVACYALRPVKEETVKAHIVQPLTAEQINALAAKLAAGEIQYSDFQAAINGTAM